MPKVSVIVPLYNKGPYIRRTLDSVLAQSFQDFEVIVVDGGSTDNGKEVVRGVTDPRIHLILQSGKGVSEARNQGVEVAHADLVAFLDADDEWMPTHLNTIIELVERYPEAGIYTTAIKIVMPNGNIKFNNYKCIPEPPWEGLLPNYFKSIVLGSDENPVWTSSAVIPKRIFLDVGGFPEGYWWGEDEDLWGRIALKYPVAFSWEIGAIYHQDAVNRACDKRPPLDYEEPFVKTAKLALNRGEVLPEFAEPIIESISLREIRRAAQNVITGNGKDARVILKQSKTKLFYKLKVKWYLLSLMPYSLLLFLQKIKKMVYRVIVK